MKPTAGSVPLVGALLGDHIDYGCGIAPLFGGKVIDQNADFLHGVNVRTDVDLAAPEVSRSLNQNPPESCSIQSGGRRRSGPPRSLY